MISCIITKMKTTFSIDTNPVFACFILVTALIEVTDNWSLNINLGFINAFVFLDLKVPAQANFGHFKCKTPFIVCPWIR